MENHPAKHFALQLGSLASLYLSLSFLLVLIFAVINLVFPDATDSVWQIESASSSARLGIAMVIVFFPTYLILTRQVNQARRQEQQGSYLGLTKWLVYLSLLIGGAVLLGDLVAVIMAFLEGEITQRFILKAASVLIVVGAAFQYYLLDARGYWMKNEKKSLTFAAGTIVVVVITLILGFANVASPGDVREEKLDRTQVTDLQNIQWQVQDYLTVNGTLPETLEELPSSARLPTAPEERPAYQYQITEQGFQLCATFTTTSRDDEFLYPRPTLDPRTSDAPGIINPDNWSHGTGEVCFERVIR